MDNSNMYTLIDTHCHINMMVKKEFDVPLIQSDILQAKDIVSQALRHFISVMINVGTSFVESKNSIQLAQSYPSIYATIGIHPNDCTTNWRTELQELSTYLRKKELYKIVGIGETGLDFHYPDYHKQRQYDAFKMQIELALEHDLALVVHTRDAGQETLRVLEEYKDQMKRGIIHCFSEDLAFAQTVIAWGYALGIGGTITYPKNDTLRTVVQTVGIEDIVLETDAPFLPPQHIRGKQNHPQEIHTIASYIAQLRNVSIATVAAQTSKHALRIFKITNS